MSGPGVAMSASEATKNSAMFVSCSTPPLSLYRHALGEVARLVHITAAVLGDAVGEQLQRHATHERAQHLLHLRDREDYAARPAGGLVLLAGYRYHVRPPGDGLLDVGEGLLPYESFAQDGDDGAVLVHEGYGAVLNLAGRVALGGGG